MATSGSRSTTDGSPIRAESPGDGIDEIGFVLGPDEPQGGLFERTGTERTGTERTGTETTRTSTDVVGAETTGGRTAARVGAEDAPPPGAPPATRSGPRRRTALLAWIAADLPNPRPTAPTRDGESTDATQRPNRGGSLSAAAAMARVIAEESLDPLPALDGWLSRPPEADPVPLAAPSAPSPAVIPPVAAPPQPVRAEPFTNGLAALLALVSLAAFGVYLFRG